MFLRDSVKKYKAGDFTSGKMGEIFKNAYLNRAIINHKQWGGIYMISESTMECVALCLMMDATNFNCELECCYLADKYNDLDRECTEEEVELWFMESSQQQKIDVVKNIINNHSMNTTGESLEFKGDFDWFDVINYVSQIPSPQHKHRGDFATPKHK